MFLSFHETSWPGFFPLPASHPSRYRRVNWLGLFGKLINSVGLRGLEEGKTNKKIGNAGRKSKRIDPRCELKHNKKGTICRWSSAAAHICDNSPSSSSIDLCRWRCLADDATPFSFPARVSNLSPLWPIFCTPTSQPASEISGV